MSVKHAFLGILAEEPRHGYDIKQVFDDKLGDFWSLNFGQIYSTLERLCKDGLVEFQEVPQVDKPNKKIYQVTQAGLEVFETWRDSPLKPEPRTLRDELFLRLMFIDETSIDQVLDLIQSQQSVYMTHMMQLTERKFEVEQSGRQRMNNATSEDSRIQIEREKVLGTLLIDVALQHAEADIRWLRHCEAKLKDVYK